MFYRTGAMADAVRRAKEAAQKAIAIDANDPGAQRALAGAFLTAGNYNAALDCVDRALALNRNSAGAYRIKGGALVLMGRYSDGRAEAQTSLRLNPRDPLGGVAAGLIAVSHYLEGNYESTVDTVERSLTQYSQFDWSRWYLVAALGQLGRKEDASAALGDMRTVGTRNSQSN